jgi:hypothetical protein
MDGGYLRFEHDISTGNNTDILIGRRLGTKALQRR